MLADVVRTDAHQLRPAAGDSPVAEAVKVLARTHKTLNWERAAVVLRLRARLLEYFPAAVAAFEDLDAPDALELLGKAQDPARAAKLTRAQVSAVLRHAGRYKIADRTDAILAALRSPQLGQPPVRPQLSGQSRIGAARTARSAQSSRGRGVARRSTAPSYRTSSSAFFDADERPSRTSQPQTRMKIRSRMKIR
jgi:hypothetical protein